MSECILSVCMPSTMTRHGSTAIFPALPWVSVYYDIMFRSLKKIIDSPIELWKVEGWRVLTSRMIKRL